MIAEQVSIDYLQDTIINVCDKVYGERNSDKPYYIVKDSTVEQVKTTILTNIEDDTLQKVKYLDLAAYVLQTGDDVMISVI